MIPEPLCYARRCVHFAGINPKAGGDETKQFLVCTAFPDGIPESIAYGDDPHVLKHPDQVGDDVYERRPTA